MPEPTEILPPPAADEAKSEVETESTKVEATGEMKQPIAIPEPEEKPTEIVVLEENVSETKEIGPPPSTIDEVTTDSCSNSGTSSPEPSPPTSEDDALPPQQQEQEQRDGADTPPPSPPPKCLDPRDSISSIDSDVSLSFDKTAKSGKLSGGEHDKDEDEGAHMADMSDSASDTGSNNGGKDSGCEVTPEITEPPFTPPSDALADQIVAQVEFYFSDANITKDAFLLKHVKRNKEGFVSLKLISSFKRVKHITKDWRMVAYALPRSTKLQMNDAGTKLRRLDPLPLYDETTPSRTVVAIHLPIQRPTIESVAELFKNCGEISLIRVLRPGNPIPADVRQFINKNPSLVDMVVALVEFVTSEGARNALALSNVYEALKVYELNCVPHPERKKKPQAKKARNGGNGGNGCMTATHGGYNNMHHGKCNAMGCNMNGHGCGYMHSNNHHGGGHHPMGYGGGSAGMMMMMNSSEECSTCTSSSEAEEKMRMNDARMRMRRGSSNYPPKCTEPVAWLQRRLSASSTEANFMFMPRRLSYGSRDSSDSSLFIPRRMSNCNGGQQQQQQQQQPQQVPTSHVAAGGCGGGAPPSYGTSAYNYMQRRMSACSGTSDSSSPRSRSNSMAVLNENIVRMPKGPDGSKGFRQHRPSLGTIYS